MRPTVAAEALAAVVAQYPELGAFTGIARNGLSVNTAACLFTTTAGEYFAKRYDPAVWEPAEHRLIRHLLAAGFPTPRLHVNAAGETLTWHEGLPYALFDRARGEDRYAEASVFAPYASSQEVQAAGAMLARFHLAARGAPLAPRPFRGLTARYRLMRAASVRDGLAALPAAAQLRWDDEVLDWLEARRGAIAPDLAALPEGVIHGDFIKRNMFWAGHTITDVVDFDLWNVDFWVFDLALALLPVGFDWPEVLADRREPDVAAMRRFVEGYETVRPLEGPERTVLPVMIETARVEFYLSAIARGLERERFVGLLRETLRWFKDRPGAWLA